MTPEKRGVGTLQKYKSRVVLRGDIVEDSGAYAVFTEQGSSASQMTAAKIMDVIARLPDCEGQAADKVSACTQMVQYGRRSCSSWAEPARSSFGRTVVGTAIWRNLWKLGWEKVFVHKKRGLFLSVHVDDIKKWLDGKKQKMAPMWKKLMKNVDLDGFSSFLDHPLGMHWTWMQTKWNYFEEHTKMFESRISARATEKFTLVGKISRKNSCPVLWYGRTYQKSALKNSANWQKKVKQLHKFSNPCLDDHQFKKEELESEGELSEVCSQTVLKCLYLARIGRPDSLWSLVSKQTGSCGRQKWTQACDRRLARLISYIHHTQDNRQYCHVVTRLSVVDWVYSKTQTLLVIWKTRNQTREGFYVYSEAEHLFLSVGCARNKLRYHTALLNLRLFSRCWFKDGRSSCVRSLGHC